MPDRRASTPPTLSVADAFSRFPAGRYRSDASASASAQALTAGVGVPARPSDVARTRTCRDQL